jgi:nucleotide-binding universal stress UspA family protein
METVFIGIDPTSPGPAVEWAADYARSTTAELVGAVAFEPAQAEVAPGWYEEQRAAARKHAERALDRVAPGVPHCLVVRDGDPSRVLIEESSAAHADLVVVGFRSADTATPGLGSTAHHLVRHTRQPVVAVPHRWRRLAGGVVLVGDDGSPAGLSTVAWAARVAAGARASLRVAFAYEPLAASYPHPPTATVADHRAAVVEAHAATVADAHPGLDVSTSVVVDRPVAALGRLAWDVSAALVVVGRRGTGMLAGRVPSRLPAHIDTAVAVVPHTGA